MRNSDYRVVPSAGDHLSTLTKTEFRSLALQTRSRRFRDHLSRTVTGSAHDYEELVRRLRNEDLRAILHPETAALLAQIVTAQRLERHDPGDALTIYDQLMDVYEGTSFDMEDKIVYADLLDRAGRVADTDEVIASLRIAYDAPADATALLANVSLAREGAGTELWLKALNSVLALDDLDPLHLVPGTAPVLDRLESSSKAASVNGPLVTIIVPTWNPGPWLWTSVRSLTQQTYADLQIIIMDDQSSPDFSGQLEDMLSLDSRIQLVSNSTNQGTYASRNTAVRDHACGDYVTIQDDDDWSHPQRIERQVAYSQSKALAVGMARVARVTDDVRFIRRGASFIQRGYSTTLISRNVFTEIGFWDPVRRNSDSEFIRRARRSKHAVGDLGSSPLMFARHREGSLSFSEVWEGYSDQARRWQNWLSAEWHERCLSAGKQIFMGAGIGLPRPYPAPLGLTRSARSRSPIHVDALIVSDCGEGSPAEFKTLCVVEELLEEGKTVGLLHVDGFRALANAVSAKMAVLARKTGVLLLSWGDETVAEVAHIISPENLTLCDSVQSSVSADRALLYASPEGVREEVARLLRLDSPNAITYEPSTCFTHSS